MSEAKERLKDEYKTSEWPFLKIFFTTLREGNLLGRLFLLSQNMASSVDGEQTIKKIKYGYSLTHSESPELTSLKIKTKGEYELDTLVINPPNDHQITPKEKKYTIYFEGNGSFYEEKIDTMAEEAFEKKRTVIGFNYRGVGKSQGTTQSFNSMVEDGIAQVQRLLDEGATPENITLSGWSMGGAVATKVTEHFHQQGKKINLFSDRSFSNLTNVVVGFIRNLGSGIEKPFGKFLGRLLKPLIKKILVANGWEGEAAAAYQALPNEQKKATWATDDTMISNYASLQAKLNDTAKETVVAIHASDDSVDSHNTPLSELVFNDKTSNEEKKANGIYDDFTKTLNKPITIKQPPQILTAETKKELQKLKKSINQLKKDFNQITSKIPKDQKKEMEESLKALRHSLRRMAKACHNSQNSAQQIRHMQSIVDATSTLMQDGLKLLVDKEAANAHMPPEKITQLASKMNKATLTYKTTALPYVEDESILLPAVQFNTLIEQTAEHFFSTRLSTSLPREEDQRYVHLTSITGLGTRQDSTHTKTESLDTTQTERDENHTPHL